MKKSQRLKLSENVLTMLRHTNLYFNLCTVPKKHVLVLFLKLGTQQFKILGSGSGTVKSGIEPQPYFWLTYSIFLLKKKNFAMCIKGGRKSLVTAYIYTVSNTFLAPVKLCYVYIGATKIYTSRPPLNPFSVQQAVRSPCLVKWWGPKLGHVFGGETICIESSYCRMGLKSTHKVTKLYTLLMVALQFPFMVTCSGWVNSLWWSIDGFKPFYSHLHC